MTIHTVFFFKYSTMLDNMLSTCPRFNKIQKIFVLKPIKMYDENRKRYYIFERETIYIGIEYMNFQSDPHFQNNISHCVVQCIRQICPADQLFFTRCNDLYVEILLPFMPTNNILKKLNVFAISTSSKEHGLYRITLLIRKCNGNAETVLYTITKNMECHLSNVPILVVSLYNAFWFIRNNENGR